MARLARRQKEKIYKRRRPLRTLLRVLGVSVLAVILLLVTAFFWFQRYIVYTPDGIRLDIPFWRDILDEIPEDAQDEPFPFVPPGGDVPTDPSDPNQPSLPEEPTGIPPIRGVLVSGETLGETNVAQILESHSADAILVAMNDETGRLWWASEVDMAVRYALSDEGDLGPMLEGLDPEIGRSALLFGFHNELMATRNPPVALDYAEGWLDPRNAEMRDYIRALALELGWMGFDEIVLVDFAFPPGHPEASGAVILHFLEDLARALGPMNVTLSVMMTEREWYDPSGEVPSSLPSLVQLAGIVHRFYVVLDPEVPLEDSRHQALRAVAEAIFGADVYRFVPVGPGDGPERGSWVRQG